MARRRVGSNQYHTIQMYAPVTHPPADLMAQVSGSRRRCGEVWGTRCRAWVREPNFSHGRHGMLGTVEYVLPVAGSSRTEPAVIQALSTSPYWEVRARVARNRACQPEVLLRLAQDPHRSVRDAARTNPSLTEEYRALLQVTG